MNTQIPEKFLRLIQTDNQEVKDYMLSIMSGLVNDGHLDDSYYVGLQMIKDNYEMYIECRDKIKEEGTVRKDNLGRTFKNQHFTMMWAAERNIESLLKSFGFTLMSRSKIKAIDPKKPNSILDEFLNDD
jgi:P27 family predicted phage terminase small subunit